MSRRSWADSVARRLAARLASEILRRAVEGVPLADFSVVPKVAEKIRAELEALARELEKAGGPPGELPALTWKGASVRRCTGAVPGRPCGKELRDVEALAQALDKLGTGAALPSLVDAERLDARALVVQLVAFSRAAEAVAGELRGWCFECATLAEWRKHHPGAESLPADAQKVAEELRKALALLSVRSRPPKPGGGGPVH